MHGRRWGLRPSCGGRGAGSPALANRDTLAPVNEDDGRPRMLRIMPDEDDYPGWLRLVQDRERRPGLFERSVAVWVSALLLIGVWVFAILAAVIVHALV